MPTPTSGGFTSFVPYTDKLLINGLLIGEKWGDGVGTAATVTYSFPDLNSTWSTNPNDGYDQPSSGWEPWDAEYSGLDVAQQDAVRIALQAWGNVARVNPVENADNASVVGDIRIAFTRGGTMQADYYAYAYTPETNVPYAGDIWLNPDPPAAGNDFSTGAAGYGTLIHELGHALGLDHPFDHPQSIYDFPAKYDTYKYTVMSYSDAPGHPDEGTSRFYPTTPMLLDIRALQYMYGANTAYQAGNDTYTFNQGAYYYQTIWDAAGIDTIRYNATTDGARIDLRAGRFSQLGNSILLSDGVTLQPDNVAIAFGVTVENAIGGDAGDEILGNGVNNALDGGGGADTLKGRSGNDTLDSGTGNDTLNGGSGNDTLAGGSGNDALDGGTGNDTMAGGTGNDTYIRNAADDVVTEDPGAGTDKVKSAVTYTLGPNLERLTLTGADAVNGTGNTLDNLLIGNSGRNTLNGGAGNDVLKGLAGLDLLTGGTGADIFDFDAVADSGIVSSARDRIRDFDESELDKIDLSTIDAKTNVAGNDAFTFIGTNAFSGSNASGQLRFDAANHMLLGSTDADSTAELSILMINIDSMAKANFIL